MRMTEGRPLVGVIMGSKSDWDAMAKADQILTEFGVAHECQVMSAHRSPTLTAEYASTAVGRGLEVISPGPAAPLIWPGWWRPTPSCR